MWIHLKEEKVRTYTLINIDEKYFVTFKNGTNTKKVVEVSKEVFFAFDEFELEDKSRMNKMERHHEQSEVYNETLFKSQILLHLV